MEKYDASRLPAEGGEEEECWEGEGLRRSAETQIET